jgi:hypothetical protein
MKEEEGNPDSSSSVTWLFKNDEMKSNTKNAKEKTLKIKLQIKARLSNKFESEIPGEYYICVIAVPL